jgi:heat shock protein HslJ
MSIAQRALAAVLSALLLAGCSAVNATPDTPPLDGTAWILASLPGRSALTGNAPTLAFAAGRAHGSDGCNRYGLGVTLKSPSIAFGPRGMSTQMACSDEVMKQAESFIGALNGARTYRVEAGRLQLLGVDGAVLATFAAQPTSLAGTRWQVTGINNGRQALVSLLGGTTVTMAFDTEGRVSGSAGCNQFNARYEAEGSKIRFLAPAATRKMCPGEGVMAQEQQFLKALEAATTVRLEGNRVEFRDAAGAMQVTATREQ